jgi:ubiquinone/menaquinone biosynthesis C-methylase UbiE
MTETSLTTDEMFDMMASTYEASTGGCTREVAMHLVDMLPAIDSNSVVLDNACGNGIAAQELLFKYPDTPFKLTCVDNAKPMVDLARKALPATKSSATLSFDVMDGVDLTYPDETFTHSITNMGLFFFPDAAKGAAQIYRTLKPGGTAIVTSWKSAGHLAVVHEAQKAVKPDDPLFRWPISDDWYEASHMRKTLEGAGFKDVEMHEKTVHYAAKSVEETCGYIFEMWKKMGPKWTDEENEEFGKQLNIAGKKAAVKTRRPLNGGKGADVVEVEGFPCVAHIAVTKK